MKQWNNIKEELYHQQEPLTEEDLKLMKDQLGSGRKPGGLWLALALLLVSAGTWYFWPQPLTKTNVENAPEQKQVSTTQNSGTTAPSGAASAESGKPIMAGKSTAKADIAGAQNAEAGKREEHSDGLLEGTSKAALSKEQSEAEVAEIEPDRIAPGRKTLNPVEDFSIAQATIIKYGDEALAKDQRAPLSTAWGKRFSARVFSGYSFALNQPEVQTDAQRFHQRFSELAMGSQPGGGLHFGAELHYRLYKSLKIGLGLNFFELQRQYNFNHQVNDIPVIDSASGHIIGYLNRPEGQSISASGQSQFAYLGLPLSLSYSYGLSTRWSLLGEARYTHYLNLYARGKELDPQSLSLRNVSRASAQDYGSVKMSMALRYQINRHLLAGFETNYYRFTGPLYENAVYSWQPQMLGLQLQMIYEF